MSNSILLPEQFLSRLQDIIPANQWSMVSQSFYAEKPLTFRVNTLCANAADVLNELQAIGVSAKSVEHFEQVYQVDQQQRDLVTHCAAVNEGRIYIQSLSSLLPALLLDAQPGEEVLDLTAAPGSKTTQLAAIMNNQGRIAAVEVNKGRFFRLVDTLKRQGASCVQPYLKDGRQVWRHCENRFDRVLLDAPCSSEGRFDVNDPESFSYWSEKKIKTMQRKQWALLCSAFQCVKPGGTLVYSTCTFAPEENEVVINRLLEKFPKQAELQTITLSVTNQMYGLQQWQQQAFHPTIQRCLRILPNENYSGFFIAKVAKNNDW